MKNALEHIIERGVDSRTIIFNASMMSITTLLTGVALIVESDYPLAVKILPLCLSFISNVGSIILYGMTKVKDNA